MAADMADPNIGSVRLQADHRRNIWHTNTLEKALSRRILPNVVE